MGITEANRRTIRRYGLYVLPFLLAALAITATGNGSGFVLMTLLVWFCSGAGAAAAHREYGVNTARSEAAIFSAIYTGAVFLSTLALVPALFLVLTAERSIMDGWKPALFMQGISITGAVAFLVWAGRRLKRLGAPGGDAGPRASLWLPAIVPGLACVTLVAIGLIIIHPEYHHVHVQWHPPAAPRFHLSILVLIPAIALVVCHDSLIRRAVRRLSGEGKVVKESAWSAGIRGTVILFGVLIAVGVNLYMAFERDRSVREILHYPAKLLVSGHGM